MILTSRPLNALISFILAGSLVAPAWAYETSATTPRPAPSMQHSEVSSDIQFHKSLYFMTPGGEPTQVPAGHYTVEVAGPWLQLTPKGSERFETFLVETQQVEHTQSFTTDQVEWFPSPESHPDLHPLVLLAASGTAYEAVGSESGVWPRWGWSSIKKAAKKVGGKVKSGAKAVGRAGKKVGKGIKQGTKAVGRAGEKVGRTVGSGAKRISRGAIKGTKAIGRAGKKVGSGVKKGAKFVGGKVKAGAKVAGFQAIRQGRRVIEKAKGGVNAVGGAAAAVGRKLGLPLPSGPPKPTRKPAVSDKDLRCHSAPSNGKDPCNPRREPKSFNLELAYRWAPIYYQDTASKGVADYLTAIDYDGTWQTNNNWDNLGKFPLRGYAYYSVVETSSHWYVLYAYYHPRDWATNLPTGRDNLLNEHENDTEGVLSIIRKDGSTFGKLEGMITYAHFDFYSFTPKGSPLKNGKETIDGTLYTSRHNGQQHPLIASEAYGHGIEAWPKVGLTNKKIKWGIPVKIKLSNTMDFKGGDGVVYYPSNPNDQFPDIPKGKNDRFVSYALIDIFGNHGFWNQRSNKQTFTDGVHFVGDKSGSCGGSKYDIQTCSTNVDTAPWGWNDIDDYVKAGEIATDPVKITDSYFNGLGKFSKAYISNPYKGIVQKPKNMKMQITSIKTQKSIKK